MKKHDMGASALRDRPLVKWLVLCALFLFSAVTLTCCGNTAGKQEKQMVMRVVPNGRYVRVDGGKGTIEVNDTKVVIVEQQMEERLIPSFSGNAVLLDYQINRYMGYQLSTDQTGQLRSYYDDLFRTYDCNGEWKLVDESYGNTVEEPLIFTANLKRAWERPRETSPGFVRVMITYNYATATLTFGNIEYIPEEFAKEHNTD